MYQSNYKVFEKEFIGFEKRALYAIGTFVEGDAKLRCPVGEYFEGQVGGNLRSSIGYKVIESKKMVQIGTNVDYAIYVEKGTPPHLILPKTASVLTWMGPAGRVFSMKVNHPGTKAQPFLTPAAEQNTAKIAQIIKNIKVATNV
jgi:HK97 gp10 family phage protein